MKCRGTSFDNYMWGAVCQASLTLTFSFIFLFMKLKTCNIHCICTPDLKALQKQKVQINIPTGHVPFYTDCYCSPLPCSSSQTLFTSSFFCIARDASICSCSRGKSWKGRTNEHERLYNWDRKTSQLILELLNLGRGFLSEKVTTKVKDPRNSTCF